MKQSMILRWATIAIVILASVAFLLPTFITVDKNSVLAKILPDTRLNRGLDLMGGIYLTLGVDVDKALETTMNGLGQEIRQLGRENAVLIAPRLADNATLEINVPKAAQDKFEKQVLEKFSNTLISSNSSLPDGNLLYKISFTESEANKRKSIALDSALQKIRNRIDQFGVAEPDIRKQEEDYRIIVQLPGLDAPERAINIVSQTAHLEFKIEFTPTAQERARMEHGFKPHNAEELPLVGREGGATGSTVLVQKEAVLTGEYLEEAYQSFDEYNNPCVAIKFNNFGAKLFERLTAENSQKAMAIVLDGKVHSMPVINKKISGGRASITGTFSMKEATDLALILSAGSLPAPVKVLEERTVGPSLGKESIDKGMMAATVGGLAVVIFMVAYYSLSGAIAASMIVLDIVMLLAGMSLLGATLTLPGIAGIVLTIGMAVDANILIFERIREEIKNGLKPKAAVETGFSRATLTILDSNITTVIAAVLLYQFGTGPVKGFAVTLTLGIIVSMFTAIFVSRTVFDSFVNKETTRISI